MKLLSIIFLQTAIILSVIACVLPNWSTNKITADINILGLSVKGDMSRHDGLWLKCEKYSGSNSLGVKKIPMKAMYPDWKSDCKTYGSPGTPEPEGNLASKILSLVGPSLLLISTLLVGIGSNHSKLVGMLGVWSLLAVVLVYPLIVLNHDINDEQSNKMCKPITDPDEAKLISVTCNDGTLSTSYFLEIGAIVLAIIGLMIHTGKSGKRRK
jgi:hypothetical protein